MLTAGDAIALAEHAIHGRIDPQIGGLRLLNLAGEALVNMHTWKWLEREQLSLDFRAEIVLTGTHWMESTLTLTKTGAFTNYTPVAGDTIKITGGTGATLGTYAVASKTDADKIVLKTSIGSAAGGSTDIAGTMENFSIALPSDFRDVIAFEASESLVNSLRFTTFQTILSFRTNQIDVGSWNYWAAIVHAQSLTDGPPVPILSIYPTPTTADVDVFKLYYRAGWVRVYDDDERLAIPEWMEPFFIDMVRAVSYAFDQDPTSSMAGAISQQEGSPLFHRAKMRDSEATPELGKMQGGAVQTQRRGYIPYLSSTVDAPS